MKSRSLGGFLRASAGAIYKLHPIDGALPSSKNSLKNIANFFENPLTKRVLCAIIYALRITRVVRETEYAPLAQLVEQLTLNQWVPGSSP